MQLQYKISYISGVQGSGGQGPVTITPFLPSALTLSALGPRGIPPATNTPSAAAMIGLIRDVLPLLPASPYSLQAKVIPSNSRVIVVGDMHGGYVELAAQTKKMQRLGCFRGINHH